MSNVFNLVCTMYLQWTNADLTYRSSYTTRSEYRLFDKARLIYFQIVFSTLEYVVFRHSYTLMGMHFLFLVVKVN